jgi:hypothetical protein
MRIAAITCLLLLTSVGQAADVIPQYLVGIWATSDAVFRGEALFEGQGLYLDTDGVGGVIGGPPPIGVRIEATYNPDTKVIAFQMTEYGKAVGKGTYTYDPARKIIITGDGVELHQRFDHISSSIRQSLGLEPKSR